MITPKEIPILFNGEMVRAIRDERKTQTRRPCKGVGNDNRIQLGKLKNHILNERSWIKSPFGKAGDVLWVRETCLISPIDFTDNRSATHPHGRIVQYLATHPDRDAANDYGITKATPSIRMPKWACRIKLKVKRVWVERVQDIKDSDSLAEGVTIPKTTGCPDLDSDWPDMFGRPRGPHPCTSYPNCKCGHRLARVEFQSLWDSIYNTWSKNPWVWCCEFENIND